MKKVILAIFIFLPLIANAFTLVIDAGHGGKDPGAVGKKAVEKVVNLNVSLLVGKMVKELHPDVKVVYTREKDVYIPLQERSKIANKAGGDLFLCIHANASRNSSAYGTETFILGLSKSGANFEVAKRENSVILLEEGYKETYQGFDPTSPESYIMFEFMQSAFVDQSTEFASYIQKEFRGYNRYDRGVRQEIFWVLHQVTMPSVLVELGFVTNPNEEQYLISATGQQQLAKSIVDAFTQYKKQWDRKNVKGGVSKKENYVEREQPKSKKEPVVDNPPFVEPNNQGDVISAAVEVPQDDAIVYKVQVFATSSRLNKGNSQFKGLECDYYEEGGLYKYTYGATTDHSEALKIRNSIKSKFPSTFIVKFQNGKKIK